MREHALQDALELDEGDAVTAHAICVYQGNRLNSVFQENGMVAADLKNMDVDALLTLRADVERALGERARELEGQLARVGGAPGKKRGRPAGGAMRSSTLKGTKVPPKYRGPGGETWAGRGAKPRWLTALLSEGHSLEEFSVGSAGSADSGDCGQGFRLIADSDSDPSRTAFR